MSQHQYVANHARPEPHDRFVREILPEEMSTVDLQQRITCFIERLRTEYSAEAQERVRIYVPDTLFRAFADLVPEKDRKHTMTIAEMRGFAQRLADKVLHDQGGSALGARTARVHRCTLCAGVQH